MMAWLIDKAWLVILSPFIAAAMLGQLVCWCMGWL